ncbi:RIP metalloprotease RseP, partial [gut metagenome]
MLGEDTEEETLKGSFNAACVWGRISVVAAGPIFNFILAFLLAMIVVAVVGYEPPEVMKVERGSQAEAAGLKPGDMIREYQGYSIDLGKDLYIYTYLNQPKEETVHLTVERNGKKMDLSYEPDISVRYLMGFNRKNMETLEVGSLIPGMPLEEAGLKAGDVITSINGTALPDGKAYEEYIKKNPLSDQPIDITYLR